MSRRQVLGAAALAAVAPATGNARLAESVASSADLDHLVVRHRRVIVDNVELFYREAGRAEAPAVLLLHGFPSSSHMFRHIIPALADRYRVIAPDYPGFGYSDFPPPERFKYTFANCAKLIASFTDAIGLKRYTLYIQDYGAPRRLTAGLVAA